jgi:hypothetical protein
VAVPEFLFAIEISGTLPLSEMIRDLASQVLTHAGVPTADTSSLVDAVHAAVDRSRSDGRVPCTVRFHAHAGQMDIDVTSDQGSLWRDARPIA